MCRDASRLILPHRIEGLVDTALQSTGRVERRSTMTNEENFTGHEPSFLQGSIGEESTPASWIREAETLPHHHAKNESHDFEKNVPPTALDQRKSGPIEGQSGHRPPESLSVGEGEVDDEMNEGSDRKSEQPSTSRSSSNGEDHHSHENGHDRDDRVEGARSTPDPVDQVGNENADDQQAEVETRIAKDRPHTENRRADEPQNHDITVRGCERNADTLEPRRPEDA